MHLLFYAVFVQLEKYILQHINMALFNLFSKIKGYIDLDAVQRTEIIRNLVSLASEVIRMYMKCSLVCLMVNHLQHYLYLSAI